MKLSQMFVAAAATLGLAASPALADEKNQDMHAQQKVTMDELPQAVKITVMRESKGKDVESMTSEQKNGKTVYEIEVVKDGKGQVIEISDAGKVLDRKAKHDEATEKTTPGSQEK